MPVTSKFLLMDKSVLVLVWLNWYIPFEILFDFVTVIAVRIILLIILGSTALPPSIDHSS